MNPFSMGAGAMMLTFGLVLLIFGGGIVHGFLSLGSPPNYSSENPLDLILSFFGLIIAPAGAFLLAYGSASGS
jgi:hypothetical protein